MDVSRIEAYNPNKINWRSLTAKEILKYEKQGVQVPDVYTQWAHQFLQNIEKYDNDEVTYENAKASERHAPSKVKENQELNKDKEIDTPEEATESGQEEDEEGLAQAAQANLQTEAAQTGTSADGEGTGEDGTEEIQLTAAQSKRKEMTDNGVSLRKQALSFTSDSKQLARQASIAEKILNAIKSDSENEIQELEGAMKELIAEAEASQNELKTEVQNINNEHSDNSTFAKIEQLQKDLNQYGKDGQSEIAKTEGNLSGYNNEINDETQTFSAATDFGTETINVGNDLITSSDDSFFLIRIINKIIGKNAISAGENAIAKAGQGETAQNAAKTATSAAIGQVNSLQNDVEQKTGISAGAKKEQGSASEQDPITGEEKEADKDVKTSQNDGTDTTDKQNISLDELVKRKVRKGEYAQEA